MAILIFCSMIIYWMNRIQAPLSQLTQKMLLLDGHLLAQLNKLTYLGLKGLIPIRIFFIIFLKILFMKLYPSLLFKNQ